MRKNYYQQQAHHPPPHSWRKNNQWWDPPQLLKTPLHWRTWSPTSTSTRSQSSPRTEPLPRTWRPTWHCRRRRRPTGEEGCGSPAPARASGRRRGASGESGDSRGTDRTRQRRGRRVDSGRNSSRNRSSMNRSRSSPSCPSKGSCASFSLLKNYQRDTQQREEKNAVLKFSLKFSRVLFTEYKE